MIYLVVGHGKPFPDITVIVLLLAALFAAETGHFKTDNKMHFLYLSLIQSL